MSNSLYDRDFHAWTQQQAAALREGRVGALDLGNLAEEIETMGRSERRELVSRLGVLLADLLKWRARPGLRGASWRLTIAEQRRSLSRLLRDNPSLATRADLARSDAYGDARLIARRETGLPDQAFPTDCPFAFDQVLDADFWPD